MTIETVGVVGAGTIGTGLAQSLAATGHRVKLVDLSTGILDRALGQISRDLRLSRLFGSPPEQPSEAVLGRIEPAIDYGVLARADIVVENVVEDWDVKREVYRRLDAVCAPGTVLAANTSCIPITRIAAQTGRPDRVIGMHFMNPVPLKPVIEMIRGEQTSESTVNRARELLAQMGKEGILVNDSAGFVANRVLMLAVNEAACLVSEGVAEAAVVDRIFTSCVGHKMGMLETADLIGLDTVLRSIEILHESFGDGRYRPCPLLRQLVAAGHLGRKSGQGFYTYPRG